MNKSIFNVAEWCFDFSRVAHDANVLVGGVELLDALGLCKWHLGHRQSINEFAHGGRGRQVCFTVILIEDVHDDSGHQEENPEDENE